MSELETLTEANTKLTEEINNNIVEHKENQSFLYSYRIYAVLRILNTCDKDIDKAWIFLGI